MNDCPEVLAKDILKNERAACDLIGRLLKAMHEQKKSMSCHEQVRDLNIEDFPAMIGTSLDNLSVSDATDAAFDHAVRVLYSLSLTLGLLGETQFRNVDVESVSALSENDVDDLTHESAQVIERFGVKLDSDLCSDLNDVLSEFLSDKCGIEII